MKTNITPWSLAILVTLTTLHTFGLPLTTAKKKIANAKRTDRSALAAMKIKNVQFDFNQGLFQSENKSNLNQVAKLMTSNNISLKLGGYTDSKGGYVYNWKLSEKRVKAVKAYLVSKGADSSRIAATEFGETKPIASNDTKTGRQKNRRVEIQFVD